MVDLLHGITYTILMDYIINSEEYLQLFRNGTFERCYTIPYKDERMYLATYE